MNQEHVWAIMNSGRFGPCRWDEVDGRKLMTNGILITDLIEGVPLSAEQYGPIARKWATVCASAGQESTVGIIYKESEGWYRAIGESFIDEAYFRCFDAPGITWHTNGGINPIIVKNGALVIGVIAVVINLRSLEPCETTPTDAEVFAHFACPENDFYLLSGDDLGSEISKVEAEIAEVEEEISKLKDEIWEAECVIGELRVFAEKLRGRAK